MNKEIFVKFPINTVVQWINTADDSESLGVVVGYSLNPTGEIILEVKRIVDAERFKEFNVRLHPSNAYTQVTAVVSGERMWS